MKEKGASYLPDAVCDGPGQEDPRQDLEPGQHHRRWHNSWTVGQEAEGVWVAIAARSKRQTD